MAIEAGKACLAGLVASALSLGSMLPADELGRPPAILSISDDAKPIELANREGTATRSKGAVKQTSAQWLDETSASGSDSTNTWKLRWRKPTNVPQSIVTDQKPLAVSRAVMWNQTTGPASFGQSTVRTVAQQTPVDPFEEPAPAQNQKLPSQSSQVPNTQNRSDQNRIVPNRSVPEFNDPFSEPPMKPVPPESMPGDAPQPKSSDLPAPQDSVMPMPERDPAPTPPGSLSSPDSLLGPTRDDVPCDRTYNDRNCCTDDARCRLAQQFVTQYKISNILLDITPSFTNTESPTAESYVPTDVKKEQDLAKAPSRTWKNRAGRTVAEGRFDDYRNGLIHVLGSDGETVKLGFNTLSDDDVCFVTAWWSLPTECSLADEKFRTRNWLASTLTWKASSLCHKPLYFEEVALERYGHSVGPIKQPFVSGAHFFGSLAALPFQMGVHPPHECQYALGYYRPGSCAPWLVPPVPISLRGALAEAGVWVGGIYIIP